MIFCSPLLPANHSGGCSGCNAGGGRTGGSAGGGSIGGSAGGSARMTGSKTKDYHHSDMLGVHIWHTFIPNSNSNRVQIQIPSKYTKEICRTNYHHLYDYRTCDQRASSEMGFCDVIKSVLNLIH